MTQFQRKRIKEEINRQNLIVDASADTLLERIKASRWTGLLLIAVALAAAGFTAAFLWSLF